MWCGGSEVLSSWWQVGEGTGSWKKEIWKKKGDGEVERKTRRRKEGRKRGKMGSIQDGERGKKIFRFLEDPCEFVFSFLYIHYFLSGEDNCRKMIMIKSRCRSVNLC